MAGWREVQTALALVDEADGALDLNRLRGGRGAVPDPRRGREPARPPGSAPATCSLPSRPERGSVAFTVAGFSAIALSGARRALAAAG